MCVHAEGRTHVVRATMKQFEERLDPSSFQRMHRSTIVNIRRIRRLKPHTNGEYFLTLEGGHELKLSRSYRDRLERHPAGAIRGCTAQRLAETRAVPAGGLLGLTAAAPAEEQLEQHDQHCGHGFHASILAREPGCMNGRRPRLVAPLRQFVAAACDSAPGYCLSTQSMTAPWMDSPTPFWAPGWLTKTTTA